MYLVIVTRPDGKVTERVLAGLDAARTYAARAVARGCATAMRRVD